MRGKKSLSQGQNTIREKISYYEVYVLHCGSSLVNRNGNPIPIALSNESKVKVLTKTPLKLRVKGESSFALW